MLDHNTESLGLRLVPERKPHGPRFSYANRSNAPRGGPESLGHAGDLEPVLAGLEAHDAREDEDVRPALTKVPPSALPTSQSPPYSESLPVPSERRSRLSLPPRVSFPASAPEVVVSRTYRAQEIVIARPRDPLMRLVIEMQWDTKVAATILGRIRICATARILAVWPVFLSIPVSTTATCCS